MALRVEQRPSLIGIENIPSRMKVKYSLADNFKMTSEFARVFISSSQPRVNLDQERIREAIGYYKPDSFIKQKKQENIAKGMEKINSIHKEKSLLQAIRNKGKPNSQIIRRKVIKDKPELNTKLGFMPKNNPDINFELGQVEVKASKAYLKVYSKPNFPDVDYKPGDAKIYLRQKGYVKVDFQGKTVDLLVK